MNCPKCHSENPNTSSFCSDRGTKLLASEGFPVSLTRTIKISVEDLIPGSIFAGRYKIIEVLGRCGMRVVYKAEDTKLNRTVALLINF